MYDPDKDKHLLEKIAVNKTLLLLAKHISSSLEKFSGWLLAGFGAAFALVLTNIESITDFVQITSIRSGISYFLIALFLGVIQKWLSAIISSSFEASVGSEEIGKKLSESKDGADIEFILNEIKRSTLYPAKWFVTWQFNKILTGDLSAPGRMLSKLSQIQSFLIFAQALLVIYSILVILNGFKV